MDISPIALQSLNNGVSTAYNTQLFAAESIYKKFTYDAPSTGDAEVYPRLNMLPGLREWVGERVVNWLTMSTFTIANKTFENTIGVKRENLEDDKYGFLTQAAGEMGQAAGELADLLIAGLMNAGHTTIVSDNSNFFDTSHPNYNADGSNGTNINYQAGAGPSWYLLATKKVLKPFIYQTRRPFVLRSLFDPNSQEVFYKNEFTWGTDGRSNAGYGLWYLAFRSDAALTVANLEAARAAMSQWRRPNGTPMGIVPDMLVTGTTLGPTARSYCNNPFLPAGDPLATGTGTVNNTFQGLATAVENPWIP
ncbi:MAG: hypothetical protein B7Z80_04600 [Rhodospirillales bacterium 20-64-7]|nr:MAG: hypothetical protein B7Z80_04600 [Rhodospirillales bacterium 20-64-7]